MAPTATSTTTTTENPAVLKLRSDAPGPVFPEGSALADLSRGPNPLTGTTNPGAQCQCSRERRGRVNGEREPTIRSYEMFLPKRQALEQEDEEEGHA